MEIKISLAAARVNANMTQEQAANAVKVNKTTIINWEKGKTRIPFSALKDLCELYNFPIENIFLPKTST